MIKMAHDMEMNYYIHVPFCASKCGYCAFYSESAPGNEIQERYLNKLFSELESSGNKCATIYIGGGTPTLFNVSRLERFLDKVCIALGADAETEISIESNPETLTPEKVAVLKRYVTRLSTGVQSFSAEFREILGRRCSDVQLERALGEVASAGFRHWNCDLIYAIPGQQCADWEREFDRLEKYPVDHVSCYNLTWEEGARLSSRLFPDMEQVIELEEVTLRRLEKMGILQYEVSNYARPGGECRHNQNVWRGSLLKGYGPAAAGFDGIDRQSEVADLAGWLNGEAPERDHIEPSERLNEIFAVNLRTVAGWQMEDWQAVPHADLWEERLKKARQCAAVYPGCFEITADAVKLTRKGLSFWDSIAEELLA